MEEDQKSYEGGYAPSGEHSDTFLNLMIEVEDTLNRFKMETLRREMLVVNVKDRSKKWMQMSRGVFPICNDLGVAEIMGMLRGRVTTFGRLTKKTDEEIVKDMFQFHRTLIEVFALRADDWELDEELIKMLQESCLALVQDIIFSSRGGFTAMNIRSSYSRNETTNISQSGQESKSILGVRL